MALPHFTNVSYTSGNSKYKNLFELNICIDGKTHVFLLTMYMDNEFSFDCDDQEFIELNKLHLDNFNFHINMYNYQGDLSYRIYYSDCKYNEFNGSDMLNYYMVTFSVKYFKQTKVLSENIKKYERELKLERILGDDSENA